MVAQRFGLDGSQFLRAPAPERLFKMLERTFRPCTDEFEPFIGHFAEALIQRLARLHDRRKIAGRLLRCCFGLSASHTDRAAELVRGTTSKGGRKFSGGLPKMPDSFHSALDRINISPRRMFA